MDFIVQLMEIHALGDFKDPYSTLKTAGKSKKVFSVLKYVSIFAHLFLFLLVSFIEIFISSLSKRINWGKI